MTLLERALDAHRAGFCVLPPMEDGSKKPDATSWKVYQKRLSTEDEIRSWYANGRHGFGLVCGRISGNLEMLEWEGRAVEDGTWAAFKEACDSSGLKSLLNRIIRGYGERTPSGGYHLLYRCPEGVEGNTILARRPSTAEELEADPDEKLQKLIETRGEGGYVVTAPSEGTVHPSGLPWELLSGGLDQVAAITAEERAALFAVARSFDQSPRQEWAPSGESREAERSDLPPGADFNLRADWATDVLEPAGWSLTGTHSGRQHWYRKSGGRGGWTSATISPDGQFLYVFSTSTELPTEVGLSKWRAYTFLQHGGDFSAAAAELRKHGFGAPSGQIKSSSGSTPQATESASQTAQESPRLPFRTARQIAEETPEEPEWLVEGLVAMGSITELDGPAKTAGKTTFLANLVRQKLEGDAFLGRHTEAGPVVWLTEERSTTFRESLRRARLLYRDDLWVLPWIDTFGTSWPDVVRMAADFCIEKAARMLIVDTLPTFAGLRGEDENAAGATLEAMEPLHLAAARPLGVFLSRHDRRAGGEVGQSGRGSTAFTGAVDIVLHLTRTGGDGQANRRRLEGIGRFDQIPDNIVIELTEKGYQVLGTDSDLKMLEAEFLLLEHLPLTEDQAVTLPTLIEGALAESKVGKTTLRAAAEALVKTHRVMKKKGVRGAILWWQQPASGDTGGTGRSLRVVGGSVERPVVHGAPDARSPVTMAARASRAIPPVRGVAPDAHLPDPAKTAGRSEPGQQLCRKGVSAAGYPSCLTHQRLLDAEGRCPTGEKAVQPPPPAWTSSGRPALATTEEDD